MKEYFEQLLFHSNLKNVSDIHLTWQKEQLIIYFRISGQLVYYNRLDKKEGKRLINLIKFISKIDLNYRQEPHTGSFSWNIDDNCYDYRVSSIPTQKGDNLVIRILNKQKKFDLQNLTLHNEAYQYLKNLTSIKSGLICVCGPTGEGKSTTLHAMLNYIYQKKMVNIITIEDPIEIVEPEFIQIQVNFNAGLDFESSLKQILRHDPDIVMIGEIRDEMSAAFALRCALTGCLVLTTLHASNCIGAMHRLLNLNINALELKEVLKSVISQRLIYPPNNDIFAIYEWLTTYQIKDWLNKDHSTLFKYQDFIWQIKNSVKNKETYFEDYQNSEFNEFLSND